MIAYIIEHYNKRNEVGSYTVALLIYRVCLDPTGIWLCRECHIEILCFQPCKQIREVWQPGPGHRPLTVDLQGEGGAEGGQG